MTAGCLAAVAWVAMTLCAEGLAQVPASPGPPPVVPPITKQCDSAKRKVEREQRALAATADSMARDQRAREACSSRGVCARYDTAIADAQRRIVRREARLARFGDEARSACNVG